MCGIAGIVSLNKKHSSMSLVRNMLSAMHHRGPDGVGEWQSGSVSIGMRRLSIIDIAGGDQPLFNEDKSIAIVGNGEIYNYVELSRLLLKRGHNLRTKSDIETIVHLYEDEGGRCLDKLQGMFAFALHDLKHNKFLLVRDRLGEKPIYWTTSNGNLIFASEMKALLRHPKIDRQVNFPAIDQYFHYYFIPEPATAFANVNKLPPASCLLVDLELGTITQKVYWSSPRVATTHSPLSDIKEQFAKACKLTLRSDVPVGISLSGGIDSGAILSFAAPAYKDTMKAFSVGYEGQPESDEREQARALAKKFKVDFHAVELRTEDVVREFPQLVFDCDDPIADIAAHSIRAVSALAREHDVPVMLGGLGGDELFWGYQWTKDAVLNSLTRFGQKGSWFSSLLSKLSESKKSRLSMYDITPGYKTASKVLRPLYTRYFSENLSADNTLKFMDFPVTTSRTKVARRSLDLLRDLWLVSNCIALSDRLSMANSVELRSPFLDHKLVETASSSRDVLLSFDKENKHWFKKAMRGILPDEVINRPKRGFTPPVASWIKGILARYLDLTLDGFLIDQRIIDRSKMNLLARTWGTLPMHWYPLYQLTLLELWGRMYVHGQRPSDFNEK